MTFVNVLIVKCTVTKHLNINSYSKSLRKRQTVLKALCEN